MEIDKIFGRNINITHEIRDRFNELEKYFIFRDRDTKYIFMLCLALGYKKGIRKEVKKPVGLLNTNSFTNEDLFTIASIAVDETKDVATLANGPLMKKIALEYVFQGLHELEQMAADYGTGDNLELAIEELARSSVKGAP